VWGVSGRAYAQNCGAFRDKPHAKRPVFNTHHSGAVIALARRCVVEHQAGQGVPPLSLTAALPGLLIYRRGFSLGNFGTRQPYKTAWRSGAMPMPEPTNPLTSNTVIIGAVIALAYSNTLSQRPGRVAVVL